MTARTDPLTVEEYRIPFGPHVTWARVSKPAVEEIWRPPLIILHGGPGFPHNYCLPMTALCEDGRAVIHYDQIGCGLSSLIPHAPADFWSVDLFVAELRNLVEHFGIQNGFHLLGQSWGGMLGPEYVLRHPRGVLSMTISNSPASMPLWTRGTDELLTSLPADVQESIRQHERAGTTDSAAYQEAVDVFYRSHLCRLHPFPQPLLDSFERLAADPTVYHTMVGPSEFTATGTMKDWSVIDRLPQISVPSLILAGEFDEATRVCWEPFVTELPNVEHRVFAGASHTPHLETPAVYFDAVGAFLRKHDPS